MSVCAKCGFVNDGNTKNCVNCLTDLHWAKVNLGKFHGNNEDTRSIGVQPRKERGCSVPEDEFAPLVPIQIVKNNGVANKGRDFVIGFFGWLMVWNLFLAPVIFYFFFLGVILELIGIALPFILNRRWLGYGALSCVIANAIAIIIAVDEFDLFFLVFPFMSLAFQT